MEIGLSLGSNLGDRLANLREARRRIAAIPGVAVVARSPVYETSPVGVPARFRGKPFLNAVLIVESALSVRALLRELRAVERAMGRARRGACGNAPRRMDADIIYAGAMRIRAADLAVPHPRWARRRFVVRPLSDVRPDLKLPGRRKTVRALLAGLPASQTAAVFDLAW